MPSPVVEEVEKPYTTEPLDAAHDSASDTDNADDQDESSAPDGSALERTKSSLEDIVSFPRELLVVAVIALAQFTTQIGLGQVLSLLHIIARHFDIHDPGTEAWLIAGYSLTVGTFILVSGRLGDIFGYKKMLVIGYLWFALWSLVAGLSVYSNHVLFIFARVLSGIGPSITMPNGLALLGVLYKPGKRQIMAFSFFGALAPAGSVIGSLFGGIFNLVWWPWAFWSTSIVLVAIAIVGGWAIPDPRRRDNSGKTALELSKECDPLGAVVGVTALVLINFAWNQAGVVGWSNPQCIVTLILGVLLFPTFFYIEARISSNPLIPFAAINSNTAFVLGCIACGWGCFGIWVYYLWQQLEVLRGIGPLLASAYLTPLIISGAIAAGTAGFLFSHLRPSVVMMLAMFCFLIGTILIATAPVHQIYWAQIFVTTLIAPWGMDMSFPAATIILSHALPREHQGVAASLVNTVVNYSISLGLGFAGTVEMNVIRGDGTPEDILHGYRGAWYMGMGLAGLGILISGVFVLFDLRNERRSRLAQQQKEKSAVDA